MRKTEVKSVKDMLTLLGEQMDNLRPHKKPTPESVQAAKGTATLVNSALGTIRLGMEYSKLNGQKPDLSFLGIPTKPRELTSEKTP